MAGLVMTATTLGATPLLCPILRARGRHVNPAGYNGRMNTPVPVVRLKNAWRSSHPWIFQKLVEKPAAKPKPGTIVDVVGVDGEWVGRGFYNGHSRIAVRILETDQVPSAPAFNAIASRASRSASAASRRATSAVSASRSSCSWRRR